LPPNVPERLKRDVQSDLVPELETVGYSLGDRGQLTTASVITVVDNAASDPKHGFKSVGDFLKTVRQAQNPGASIDERLLKKPPGRDDSRRCCGTRPTGRRREKSLHGGL